MSHERESFFAFQTHSKMRPVVTVLVSRCIRTRRWLKVEDNWRTVQHSRTGDRFPLFRGHCALNSQVSEEGVKGVTVEGRETEGGSRIYRSWTTGFVGCQRAYTLATYCND